MKTMMNIVCGTLLLVGAASALEVADLPSAELTRRYADEHFSKDYEFIVLEDNSIRRMWQAGDCSITIDFDIRSDKPLSIYISYKEEVDHVRVMEDMAGLVRGRNEGCKWSKAKEASARGVGLSSARFMRLTDGSFLFLESGKAEKSYSRLIWFSEAPRRNRMELAEAKGHTGRTAMGTRAGGGSAVEEIIRDEEKRRSRTSGSSPKSAPVSAPQSTPIIPAPSPSPAVPESEPEQAPSAAPEVPADNLLAALGIDLNNKVVKWGLIGGGVLLLFIIWNSISAARHRARQQAAFEALLERPGRKKKKD